MPTEPLSAAVLASAQRMHADIPTMARPDPDDFAYLDRLPATTAEDQGPEPPAPREPEPGWDASAFDALPPETRSAVMAATAHSLGRGVLQLEAERELTNPEDVHHYLTDPTSYVDDEGRVDRDSIRADVANLVRRRPQLSRYGNGAGQEPHRPDTRRRAAPDNPIGAKPEPHNPDAAVPATLARMSAATGVTFAEPGQ